MSDSRTYSHPRPAVTVDLAITRSREGREEILLIRRGRDPFRGAWALPGGFVDENEPLDDAARRELAEETGLSGIELRQAGAYGDPGRDPRGHTVTIVYEGRVESHVEPRAGDDASEARWFTLGDLPEMAFDHGEILAQLPAADRRFAGADVVSARPAPGDTLRLPASTRRDVWRLLVDSIESYFRDVSSLRVIPEMDPDPIRAAVGSFDLERGGEPEAVVATVVDHLRRFQLHEAHPRYFGLFNPASSTMGIVGDALAATFNPQLAAWSHSPYAVEVERRVIDEIGHLFGYPEGERDGTLASGGAEANHTALLTAICHASPEYRERGARALPADPAIYVSEDAHHSTLKAARLCGLGTGAIRTIRTTEKLTLDVADLESAIDRDRHAGFRPLMVVGTAGTTGAGAIDPLREIAEVAEREGLWYHVDAAWGGAAMLLDEMRPHFAGLSRADSITFDAHKWLSVPMGAGIYVTRHPGLLDRTFATRTGYMPKEADGLDVVNPYAHSIQWSRRFIGLKLFLSIACAGWNGYREVIRHQIRMGEELRGLLREAGWDIVNDTPLPVVCFRGARGATERDGAWLERVVREILSEGRAWISTTSVSGETAIRACITNFETGLDDLRDLVTLLEHARNRG